MRIGSIVVVIWLVIGALAAAQRGYFNTDSSSCSTLGTTVVTAVAGPLNYVGLNPKVKCEVPAPST